MIRRVTTTQDFASFRVLVERYIDALPFELDFQDYKAELDEAEAEYGPPTGAAFLATLDGADVGVVGVRRLEPGIAELKRMYVDPSARGRGIGVTLTETAVDEARHLGYGAIRLDSVASLAAALAIYRRLGFVEIPPYRHNPRPDALFLELSLS